MGFPKRLNPLFHLGDVVFTPRLALEGVNLGGDADFSGKHSGEFYREPTGVSG